MTDCKGIVADQDILDKQPDDPLALLNIHGLGALLQPGEKTCQGFGEFQPGFLFPRLADDGLPFSAGSLFLFSQLGHARAQLVDGDQVFLISLKQAVYRLADPRQSAVKVFYALAGGIALAGRVEAS